MMLLGMTQCQREEAVKAAEREGQILASRSKEKIE
jgi:hypothetical protein